MGFRAGKCTIYESKTFLWIPYHISLTSELCKCATYSKPSFPGGASGKPLANTGDIRNTGLIPGLGRSPEKGNGNPL